MKRTLKRQKDEKLYDWTVRLSTECQGMTAKQLLEVLHEVCITSYTMGSNSAILVMKKHPNTF